MDKFATTPLIAIRGNNNTRVTQEITKWMSVSLSAISMKVKHNRHLFSGLSLWDGDLCSSHITIGILWPAVAQGQSDLLRRVSNQWIAFKLDQKKSNSSSDPEIVSYVFDKTLDRSEK